MEITQEVLMQELWFLHSARRQMLIDIRIKLHKDSLYGFQVIVRTRLRQHFVIDMCVVQFRPCCQV